jgi:hypothetical protein
MLIPRPPKPLSSGVLSTLIGPDSGKVTGDWRELHNRELLLLLCSPNTGEIKSRKIRKGGNVACMEEKIACRVGLGNLQVRDHLEHLGIDGLSSSSFSCKYCPSFFNSFSVMACLTI